MIFLWTNFWVKVVIHLDFMDQKCLSRRLVSYFRCFRRPVGSRSRRMCLLNVCWILCIWWPCLSPYRFDRIYSGLLWHWLTYPSLDECNSRPHQFCRLPTIILSHLVICLYSMCGLFHHATHSPRYPQKHISYRPFLCDQWIDWLFLLGWWNSIQLWSHLQSYQRLYFK